MADDQMGLEVGRRRVLHPGPLRWLRATAWMVLLFIVFSLVYAGAQAIGNPLFKTGGHLLEVLEVVVICAAGLGLYGVIVWLAEGRWPEELNLRQAPAELAIGLAIGAAMLSLAVGELYLLNVYEINGPRASSAWGTIA
ncbi:MAG TPA: CPBP family intramembrane glutamate endopeptidase, partial [Caulobacter sp.]|nr:CPBP family intramembrane glutamate endopeptidase [Caulobacter sp.]